MVREIPVEACPDCGVAEAKVRYRDGKYALRECAGCGVIYCSPKTILDFDQAYTEGYYRSNYLPREKESLAYYARSIIPLVRKTAPARGRILDIGCGTGFFLKAARDAGFRVVGVEPSEFASGYCRTHWGMECHTGFFEDMSLGGFDMIVLLNVFTQLTTDKKLLLEKIRKSLNPGGTILIKTICWNRRYPSACHLLPNESLKRLCLHLPLQHYIYDEASIRPCLEAAGYRVSAVRKCYSEWSILSALDVSRLKVSWAILIKWVLLKLLCGPFRTDMLVVATKTD